MSETEKRQGEKGVTYPVTFVTSNGEVQAEAASDEYLLDVATAAGLDLPHQKDQMRAFRRAHGLPAPRG